MSAGIYGPLSTSVDEMVAIQFCLRPSATQALCQDEPAAVQRSRFPHVSLVVLVLNLLVVQSQAATIAAWCSVQIQPEDGRMIRCPHLRHILMPRHLVWSRVRLFGYSCAPALVLVEAWSFDRLQLLWISPPQQVVWYATAVPASRRTDHHAPTHVRQTSTSLYHRILSTLGGVASRMRNQD